jgi:hypothetical protein
LEKRRGAEGGSILSSNFKIWNTRLKHMGLKLGFPSMFLLFFFVCFVIFALRGQKGGAGAQLVLVQV